MPQENSKGLRDVSARRIQEVLRLTGEDRLDKLIDNDDLDKMDIIIELIRIRIVLSGQLYYDYDAQEWVE